MFKCDDGVYRCVVYRGCSKMCLYMVMECAGLLGSCKMQGTWCSIWCKTVNCLIFVSTMKLVFISGAGVYDAWFTEDGNTIRVYDAWFTEDGNTINFLC